MAVIREIFDDMERTGNDITTHLSLEYTKNEKGLPRLNTTYGDRHFGASDPYGRSQSRGIQCPECYTHIDSYGDRSTAGEYNRSRYPDGRVVEYGRNFLPRERRVAFDTTDYCDDDEPEPEYNRSYFPEETQIRDLGRNRYYDEETTRFDKSSMNDYDRVVQFARGVANDNKRINFARTHDSNRRYRYPERSITTPLAIDRRDDGRYYDRRARVVGPQSAVDRLGAPSAIDRIGPPSAVDRLGQPSTVDRLVLDGVRGTAIERSPSTAFERSSSTAFERSPSTYNGIRNERPLKSSLKQSRPSSRYGVPNQYTNEEPMLEQRYPVEQRGTGFRASYNIPKYAICGRAENISVTVNTVANGRALKGNRNEFDINAVVKRPDGTEKPISVKKSYNGKCSMEFREVFHGMYQLDICVNGLSIPQSPFSIEVVDGWHMGKRMTVGTAVVRGPDWKQGDEDGYSGKGVVTKAVEEFRRGWTISVQWDQDGTVRQYSMDHYACPLRICDFYSNVSTSYYRQ